MTVIAIATVSGNDGEILSKCLALAAMANDCQPTIIRVAGPGVTELPFIWPDDCPVQQISSAEENLGEQLSSSLAQWKDARTVLLDCSIEVLGVHLDVWVNVDLLLVPVNPSKVILGAARPSLTRLLQLDEQRAPGGHRILLLDTSASPRGKERLLPALLQMVDEAHRELWVQSISIISSAYRTPHWAELDDIYGWAPASEANAATEGIKDLWGKIALALDQEGLDPRLQEPRPGRTARQLADHLIGLAEDVRLVDLGRGPSSEELVIARGLDEWRVLDDGRVEGRLVLPAGKDLGRFGPTRVFRVDPAGCWVLTSSELLRLLTPALPSTSAVKNIL